MLRKHLIFTVFILIFVVAATGVQAQKAPQWLEDAAKTPTPVLQMKNVPGIVLRNEQTVSIAADGTVVKTIRYAVRILEREGRNESFAQVVYSTDSVKVRDFNAWMIKRGAQPKSYGKKETIDAAFLDNDLYNELRRRYINASNDAEVGDVFGYESVTEEKRIFSQFQHYFQEDIPVVTSRFTLTMPTSWNVEGVVFNAPKIEPTVNGGNYTWEMRDLEPISPEARSPKFMSLVPRLAVSIFPDQATSRLKTFSSWNDVAKWMNSLNTPQMTVNDAMAAKTQELVAGAKTEHEKIRAISRYVQQIQYISIQVGTGSGGGYTPRPSTDVFAKAYGDCKDKANLMRAMLSLVNIPAYLVSITAGDPAFVRTEWPSPHQFNHAIIAVKISDQTVSDAVATHPKLGRLLMFDPTDQFTPLDDLPEHEQGSYALIDHPETNELLKMPVLPAEANKLERTVVVSLDTSGSISGHVIEKTLGQSARAERSQLKNLSSADYSQMIQRWISRGATGAKTSSIVPTDDHEQGTFNLKVDFSAFGYAQIMQQRLMVFKPAIISRLDRLSFSDGRRMNPYMIDATFYSENVRIKLPEGFEVDEMPEPVNVETNFGKYSADYKVDDGHIVFSRRLRLERTTIPADKYDTVRGFFGRVHAAEQSPVVLIKK